MRISIEGTSEGTRVTTTQEHSTMVWRKVESETSTKIQARKKTHTATREERAAETYIIESKTLIVMQVNCRNI